MNLLFIGDVFGRPGRHAVRKTLPDFCRRERVDFVIVNGENAAGGKGLSPSVAEELFAAGCHVITGGNHSFANKEIFKILWFRRQLPFFVWYGYMIR